MRVRPSLRISIFARDAFTCQYCGRRAPQFILHVEHIRSIKDGGSDHPSNLATSCSICNLGKGERSLLVEELQDVDPLDFRSSVFSLSDKNTKEQSVVGPTIRARPQKNILEYQAWILERVADADIRATKEYYSSEEALFSEGFVDWPGTFDGEEVQEWTS